MTIEIRPLRSLTDMRDVVELQKTYWGQDLESVIPAQMLFSLAAHGGHVLTAFDDGQMVGVLVGFLGTSEQESKRPAMAGLQIVSKRMVVLPEYRNQGIGYRLKLAQRDTALTQGIRLVTWTFDPLLAPNAHLNVRKLGVMSSIYHEDYYGTEGANGLVTLGTSDRLVAEWWVTNRRVEERIFGSRTDLSLDHYLEADTAIINPTMMTADGLLIPAETEATPTTSMALVEIPLDYPRMVTDNPVLAQRWRLHIRAVLIGLFARGYVITDFLRESHEGWRRAFYLLAYNGPGGETSRMN